MTHRWTASLIALAGSALAASPASADVELDKNLARNEPAFMSTSFLDPLNRTRAHVTTRMGFTSQGVQIARPREGDLFDQRDTVVGSVEIQFALRISENFSFSAVLPIGWEATDGFDGVALFGNVRLGFNAGGEIQFPELAPANSTRPVPKLGLAGALEFYLPTAYDNPPESCGARRLCAPMQLLRSFRALEPELWTNDAAWVRARWHADFRIDVVQAELELGLTPGVTIEDTADFVLLGNWAARIAVLPIPELEPFAEIGASYGLVLPDDRIFPSFIRLPFDVPEGSEVDNNLDTPVRLTLGARLHLASASFDPAVFVSFDFDNANVMVGFDLAGMVRSRPGARQRRERDPLDFDRY